MPEAMLQLTVSLFIFSRELLCLHKLPSGYYQPPRYPHRPGPSRPGRSVQGEPVVSSIYLVFSRRVQFADSMERDEEKEEKCLIAVSVRTVAQPLGAFLDEGSSTDNHR